MSRYGIGTMFFSKNNQNFINTVYVAALPIPSSVRVTDFISSCIVFRFFRFFYFLIVKFLVSVRYGRDENFFWYRRYGTVRDLKISSGTGSGYLFQRMLMSAVHVN